MIVSRRKLLLGAAAGTGALILPGCDAAVRSPTWNTILSGGEKLTYGAQRALQFGQPLAREPLRLALQERPRILVRDCRSFVGLGETRLRIALLDRGGNRRLLRALRQEGVPGPSPAPR
jgi:hypothetical protein